MMPDCPVFHAYTMIEQENEDPYWLNIGIAFIHADDKGFTVLLEAVPLDGKLVLRAHEQRADKSGRTRNKKLEPLERI